MRWARRMRALGVLLFDRGVLRAIFEHARNIAIASVITAAGLDVVSAGPVVKFTDPTVAGYFVVGIGLSLLALNFLDGVWRLARFRSHVALQVALGGIYLIAAWRVAQLVLRFKTGMVGG